MADVNGSSASFFSEDTYQAFVAQKKYIQNERLRGENETIFDAALSEEADFRKYPEGDKILENIRNYK